MSFCDMKEVTLSPQGEHSRFRKLVTLPELLLCETNPSYFFCTQKVPVKVIFTLWKMHLH